MKFQPYFCVCRRLFFRFVFHWCKGTHSYARCLLVSKFGCCVRSVWVLVDQL